MFVEKMINLVRYTGLILTEWLIEMSSSNDWDIPEQRFPYYAQSKSIPETSKLGLVLIYNLIRISLITKAGGYVQSPKSVG